jgi:hypothetical protein
VSDVENLDDWGEITVRTPGWKASADQVADFLRGVFPEDVVHRHQQRVAEAGLREAVGDLRKSFVLVGGLLDMLDPDHREFGGYFPSRLVCPHHDIPVRPPYLAGPVFQPCPGVPRCRAGSGIRETRR